MNKRLLLISTLFVVSCLGWPGFGKKTPEFKIGDSIEVPENRIIIDKRIFVRPLDLNESELITHARFMDLYDEHEASCLPTIIVRVNQGESEQIYNLYNYYSWITKNPGRSPINTPIKNENYYYLKKIGEKLCLINLGDKPAISVDDMIYYCFPLEHENNALWKHMINSLGSKLIYGEPRMRPFRVIISDDTDQIKLDKLMQFIPSYSETDPFIHLLRFYCCKYYAILGRDESAIELFNAINFTHLNSIYQACAKYWLGRSLSSLNRCEKSIKILEEALSSNELKTNLSAYAKYWLGRSLSCLNRNEKAIKALEESLSSNQLNKNYQVSAKYWLGRSLSILNRNEEAIKPLQEALSSNELKANYQVSAKYWLGKSLSCLNRNEKAIKALEESLSSNQLNKNCQASAKYWLGRAKLNSNLEEAKLLFREVELAEQLDEIEAFECRKRLLILELKDSQQEADRYLAKILSSTKDGIKTRVDLGKELVEHNSENFLLAGYPLLEQARDLSGDQKTYYHEQVSPELMHALRTRIEQIRLKSEVATVKSDLLELRGDIRREFSQVNGMLAAILSRLPVEQERL